MDRTSNMRFLVLGAFLAVVAAEAPLAPYPPALPARVYGVPKVELPLAPYPPAVPAPVYGVPRIELPPIRPVATSYEYELVNPPKPIEILAPYPAPVLKSGPYPAPILLPTPVLKSGPYPASVIPAPVYGLPKVEIIKPIVPVASSYSYHIPPQPIKLLKTYVAPAPVYGPPRLEPVIPAPVYGVPKIEIPATPVLTSYKYSLPAVQRLVKLSPYPAAVPVLPVVPHSQYGLPHHLL